MLSFRRASLVDNAFHMKIPLKYDTHIHLASLFNCTLVVAPEGIFIVSLMFLFLRCYTLFAFVEAEIQSASVFVRSEIQFRDPVPLRDSDVASLLADVPRLYRHLPFATLADPPIKYPSAPNINWQKR